MPRDPESGLYFDWIVTADGQRCRDFTMSVDDRFEEDPVTGEWIQVRAKASGRRYDDDDLPEDWPEDEGAKPLQVIARWSADPDRIPDQEQTIGQDGPIDDRARIRRDKADQARGPPRRPRKAKSPAVNGASASNFVGGNGGAAPSAKIPAQLIFATWISGNGRSVPRKSLAAIPTTGSPAPRLGARPVRKREAGKCPPLTARSS